MSNRMMLSETESDGLPIPMLDILVVDDNEDSADSMSLLLQHEGHRVRTAYSGAEALRAADAAAPDVILLDIGMPGMMGYEVAQRLRVGAAVHSLLIAVTGYGQDSDIARTRDAGFDHHLVKPIDFDELQAMLADRFGRRTTTHR